MTLAADYAARIGACNDGERDSAIPWWVAAESSAQPVGWLRPSMVAWLETHDGVLFQPEQRGGQAGLALQDGERGGTAADRSHAVAGLMAGLRQAGLVEEHWGEDLDVRAGWSGDVLLWLERSAADGFGIRTTDVKLLGFAEANGDLALWLARRAATKRNDPGLWDVTVGGTVAAGESIMQALAREAAEEAGLAGTRLEDARRVGRVSYCRSAPATANTMGGGLQVGSCICFEARLGLAAGLTPADGEVEEFVLMPVADVRALLQQPGKVLYNSALVLIDFLLRHDAAGVSPDEADALRQALRQ